MTPAVLDADACAPLPRRMARAAAWPRALCPECLARLEGARPGQLFCSAPHKRAYNNRWLKRGGVLAPLQAAARATRGGTRGPAEARDIGRRARADADAAQQLWREEDAAAGRMPVVEYIALRYRHGFVEVVR